MLIGGVVKGWFGVWGFLSARSSHRTLIKLEQQRHRATLDVVENLPAGITYLDYRVGEQLIVIRALPTSLEQEVAAKERRQLAP